MTVRDRLIRRALPREAVALLEDLVKATGWEPGKILGAGLAELAMRLVIAGRRIDETLEDGQWQ